MSVDRRFQRRVPEGAAPDPLADQLKALGLYVMAERYAELAEEARKAKFQGAVLLAIVILPDGSTSNIRVIRPLGLGLDEKAIEAVTKWRFRPSLKDGKPVAVSANVEVNFRLL